MISDFGGGGADQRFISKKIVMQTEIRNRFIGSVSRDIRQKKPTAVL